ncbi:MAG: SusC/RagA family TonB-linked outer membrane protein [Chitinophagaceae bacterium]|nr:MAG: SusC/RagA family TonB-linked outer membrane protein [Chitinophagaceae bacterium]
MKFTTLFLLFAFLQVSAHGFTQDKITVRLQSADLKKALLAIEKQSSYHFLYNQALIVNKPKVNINVSNADINTVLNMLFSNTGIRYRMMENNLIILKKETDQAEIAVDVRISGKVTGTANEALAGVSVLLKGTSVGTTTDANGNYAITVPDANAILIFSYVGFGTQEVVVGNRTAINITLSASASELNTVVVVGYGTQRKRDLTGSINSVSGEEIARMPNTNPIGSLQGKVAGLTISNSGAAGSSPVVRIRGINSTNSASPVYVVDGVLHDNIDFLNPADIETIDVLRDPSSIAIYGMRGANGVIAVTLKKAARGQTTINLQSSVGVQRVIDKIAVTDAEGFKKLYSAQLSNLNAAPFDYTNYTANTDWQDQIFRDAFMSINNLSIANSGEKSSTRLSFGYTNQNGVLKYDNYQRYLIRMNEEIRFNDNIKVGGDINGFHWISNPAAAGLNNALWAAPIVPIQLDENTYYSMPSFQRAQVGNPVAALNRNNRTSVNKGFRVIGSLFAEIKFLKSFTWRSTVYTDLGFNNNRDYTPLPVSFINLGEGASPTTTTLDNTVRTGVSQSQSESKRFQQDHTLTFDKRYGSHSLTFLGGFTSIYSHSSFVNGNRRDTTVNVPNNPDFWYLSSINSNNPGAFGGGGGESSLVGAFARASYSFMNKYLINATIRRDGSSKFSPENRWGTFGSVGLGWVVSDEDFFSKIKGLDFLKVRGAWGLTGNSNGIADNLYKPGISNASTAVFGNNVYTAIQAAYIPDPNLHFEVVRGIDVGFDLRAFKRKLNLEFTLYNRTTTDILTTVTLPNETRGYFTNLGKITNKGVEVTLSWNDRIGKDFTFNIAPNFSYNKNVVNSIGNTTNFQLIGNSGANLTETGRSIGYFFGYKQIGIYQSTADLAKAPAFTNSLPGDIAYEDVNNDGMISSADRTYLGTPFPPYNFGLNITAGYKGFDFIIEGQGVAGNKIYTQRRIAQFAPLNYESNRLNAWTGPGTSNVEPILDNSRGNNYLFSSYYLEPGDYFRLRTLQLGYTFNQGTLRAVGIKRARVYISGQNIKSWSQVTGYSPEAQIGSILGGGADNGVYPVPAVYSFGINVTF